MSGSARYFQAIIGHSDDIFAVVDRHDRLVYLSPAGERWSGFTVADLKTRSLIKLLHPADLPRAAVCHARALKEPSSIQRIKLRFKFKDGTWHTLLVSERNLLADPDIGGVLFNIRDDTEQQQADEQLVRQHNLAASIMRASPEAIIVTDLNGAFADCNREALRLVAAGSKRELAGLSLADFMDEVGKKRLEQNIGKLIKHGAQRGHEYAITSRDGHRIMIEVSSGIVNDPSGQPQSIVAIVRDVTERKRDEERRSALEKAVETMQLGLTISDPGGAILYTNAAEAAMHGYTVGELMGQSVRIFAPDWLWHKMTMDQEKRMRRYGRESVNVRKDGSEFPVQILSDVVKDEQGTPVAVVTTSEDISNRKSMDHLLKKREEYFRSLIENAQDIIAIVNSNGVIKFVSPAVTPILGHQAEALLGTAIFDLVPEQERVAVRASFASEIGQPGEVRHLKLRLSASDGGARHFEAISKNLLDDPVVGGVIINARDITQRVSDEERLRLSSTALDSAADAIVITDRAGQITWTNRAFTALTGYDAAEVLGQNLRLLKSDRQDAGFYRELWRTIMAGQVWRGELINRRKDGRHYHEQQTIAPVQDEGGAISHFVVIKQDITERKQAEEQIKYLSFHDMLTGLYNRAFFEEGINRLDAERQYPVSIILGDSNGLKLTNDVFGHDEGDKLLCTIARILRACCRQEDIIARWGGDEFAILLPKTPLQTAIDLCERIRATCRDAGRSPVKVSIALGVATKENAQQQIRDVLKLAENRMYKYKLAESRSAQSSIIATLEKDLWASGHESEEHIFNIKNLAFRFGLGLKLPDPVLDELLLAATFHDIGKLSIDEAIMTKRDKLTDDQWETIRKHSEIGYRIAKASPEIAHIADAILYHHERWDGTGYPEGKQGNEIPLVARMIHIVDAYDMMQRERPYRAAKDKEQAMAEMEQQAGKQFDAQLVKSFLALVK